jgi:hypothetical protein
MFTVSGFCCPFGLKYRIESLDMSLNHLSFQITDPKKMYKVVVLEVQNKNCSYILSKYVARCCPLFSVHVSIVIPCFMWLKRCFPLSLSSNLVFIENLISYLFFFFGFH